MRHTGRCWGVLVCATLAIKDITIKNKMERKVFISWYRLQSIIKGLWGRNQKETLLTDLLPGLHSAISLQQVNMPGNGPRWTGPYYSS